ncbi:hypothetical protein Poli38472_005941 [Pythium oligandrum]|uniref:F-box domain-containing protein n=1 Tax=Pythium oligandrum TaxID=41045 RepID=A0A8K1FSE6_PYTOL|nr:hypothetical protein Poli38472_005941 [Pythium oligandrum]|eukprot:TMW68473.1 hypothetical protein Poli38472_005941 [Pythium oligandrum]
MIVRVSSRLFAAMRGTDEDAMACACSAAAAVATSPSLPVVSPLGWISEDVIEGVTEFLTPDDVRHVMQVNEYWKGICMRDSVWLRFCLMRWKLESPRELLRICGTDDFEELYGYLERNGMVPRGKYTQKNQLIWGRNRQEGADVWITIAHRSDCRLLSSRSSTYIQLRLVVQNLQHKPLTVDFRELKVHWKDGLCGRVLGLDNSDASTLAPRLVAFNGEEQTKPLSNHMIDLNFFEFAVVMVNVECDGCEFEADFLERCSTLWLPIRRPGPCTSLSTCRCGLIPDNYHHGSVRIPIVDESVVWKHYRSVSGRFMVLDTRSASLKHPFGHCHPVKTTPKSRRKTSIS